MSDFQQDKEIQSNKERLDKLLHVMDNPTRVNLDGTEYMVLSLPDRTTHKILISSLPGGGGGSETLPTTGNSTTLDLSNHEGILSFMNAASTANTFNPINPVLNGYNRAYISTAGKTVFPTVTGSTLILGHDFEADAFYDLVVECVHVDAVTPANNIINYFFLKR